MSRVTVAIVGAGFGGLGAAIRLKRASIDDFVVLERAGEVGGAWHANTASGRTAGMFPLGLGRQPG